MTLSTRPAAADSSGVGRREVAFTVSPRLSALSKREIEIAYLVGSGYTNRQIAGELMISEKTVETYMSRIFKKLKVTSRARVANLVGLEH